MGFSARGFKWWTFGISDWNKTCWGNFEWGLKMGEKYFIHMKESYGENVGIAENEIIPPREWGGSGHLYERNSFYPWTCCPGVAWWPYCQTS